MLFCSILFFSVLLCSILFRSKLERRLSQQLMHGWWFWCISRYLEKFCNTTPHFLCTTSPILAKEHAVATPWAFGWGAKREKGCRPIAGWPFNEDVRWPPPWNSVANEYDCTNDCHETRECVEQCEVIKSDLRVTTRTNSSGLIRGLKDRRHLLSWPELSAKRRHI